MRRVLGNQEYLDEKCWKMSECVARDMSFVRGRFKNRYGYKTEGKRKIRRDSGIIEDDLGWYLIICGVGG